MDAYELQREQLARRRKVADALLAQSMQSPGGTQMVSGIAVRRSPLEGLSEVAQALSARSQLDAIDKEERGLIDRQRTDLADAVAQYTKATTARPGSTEQIVDEQANGGEGAPATITAPAYTPTGADKQAAALSLMGKIGDPRDAAKLMVADALKKPENPYAKVDPKDYTPESVTAFNRSGGTDYSLLRPRVKREAVNLGGTTQFVDPYEPPKDLKHTPGPGTATELSRLQAERDALPEGDPRRKTYDDAIKKATTHQPATTVNVSTEKKYGEQFGGLVAKSDIDMRDAALKAPQMAERSNAVLSTLASGKVLTGTGADIRLQLGKAMNLAGAGDKETIANTETLVTSLAQNTLDAIKASGLGAGSGFSNADRDFLEKAVGGKITLEADTIKRLATLGHRAAQKSAEAWSTRVKDIPESALTGTGIKRDPITVPAIAAGERRAATRSGGAVSPETRSLLDKYAPAE